MSFRSRTLSNTVSALLPSQSKPADVKRAASQDVPNSLQVSSSTLPYASSPPTLETLGADIIQLISSELRGKHLVTLKALALCSHTLRDLVAPVVYSGYQVHLDLESLPLDRISKCIRRITVVGSLDCTVAERFEALLDRLPRLKAITFKWASAVTWDALKICLLRPQILSLTFGPSVHFGVTDPYPGDEVSALAPSTTAFVHSTRFWRESSALRARGGPRDLDEVFAREAKCMSALVPSMHKTLERLTLSMECAPLAEMASLPWPKLRHLEIYGLLADISQPKSLPLLLNSLVALGTLTICFFRKPGVGRLPILGQPTSPVTCLSGMRSLTLAYPDPSDAIFSIDTSQLLHLSLCDRPRHYSNFRYRDDFGLTYDSPILSPTECLSILQRMDMPCLSSLELVYQVDKSGADDELLTFVTDTFPKLEVLELHRYRADRKEHVDHAHVVNILARAKSLRVVRLNLDFHEDHGPYCDYMLDRDAWLPKFKDILGPAILKILEASCPLLEHVDLLYHGTPTSTWAEFHPRRCAEPRFVLDEDDQDRYDIPSVPGKWWPRNPGRNLFRN